MLIKQLLGDKLALQILIRRNWGNKLIATPPGAEKKTDEAIVRYIGEGYKGALQVGDRVLYDRYRGEEIKIGSEVLYFTPSSAICAKVEQ